MPKYNTKSIIHPDLHADLSAEELSALMINCFTAADDIEILGCPKLAVTSVFEVDHSDIHDLVTDEEIKECISIEQGAFLDSSLAPAFHNHPINFTCVKRFGHEIGQIKIGHTACLQGVSICSYELVSIGDNVIFGPHVTIMDCSGHTLTDREKPGEVAGLKVEPVIIESNVWVGYGVIILPGVTIGEGAVVGAGSVVTRDVPPLSVVGGNPARVLKSLQE